MSTANDDEIEIQMPTAAEIRAYIRGILGLHGDEPWAEAIERRYDSVSRCC